MNECLQTNSKYKWKIPKKINENKQENIYEQTMDRESKHVCTICDKKV